MKKMLPKRKLANEKNVTINENFVNENEKIVSGNENFVNENEKIVTNLYNYFLLKKKESNQRNSQALACLFFFLVDDVKQLANRNIVSPFNPKGPLLGYAHSGPLQLEKKGSQKGLEPHFF